MDDAGDVVNFTDGHYKDGVMQFVADKTGQDGVSHLQRLTFHNLGPDLVRQVGEHSEDHGKTWQLNYDFNYLRKKKV